MSRLKFSVRQSALASFGRSLAAQAFVLAAFVSIFAGGDTETTTAFVAGPLDDTWQYLLDLLDLLTD